MQVFLEKRTKRHFIFQLGGEERKFMIFSQKADQTTFYSPTEGERKVFEFFSENTPPICPTDLRMTKRQDFFDNF